MARSLSENPANIRRRQRYRQKQLEKAAKKAVQVNEENACRKRVSRAGQGKKNQEESIRDQARLRARENGVLCELDDNEKHMCYLDFEEQCGRVSHNYCKCCHKIRLAANMHIVTRGPNIGCCEKCAKLKNPDYYMDKNMLPIWHKDGIAMYNLPECLATLTMAEKMLISRVSVLVPLTHISKGTFGLKAHCCAFEQELDEFIDVLPRRPDDASIIHVVQTIRSEIGGNINASLVDYKVRRAKVLAALMFLKEHSTEYNDIRIDPAGLDWINGPEGYLKGLEINTETDEPHVNEKRETFDNGPAPTQTEKPEGDDNEYMAPFGYVDEGGIGKISPDDEDINDSLKVRNIGRITNVRQTLFIL